MRQRHTYCRPVPGNGVARDLLAHLCPGPGWRWTGTRTGCAHPAPLDGDWRQPASRPPVSTAPCRFRC